MALLPVPSSPISLSPLDEVGWLAGEPESFRHWVAETGLWRVFRPGQVIYLAGEGSDGLYGLAEGTIELTFPLLAGEPVGLYLAQKGFWIGDNASLAGRPRLVSMTALLECRMLHLPHHAIMSLLKERPQYWQSFYHLASTNMTTSLNLLAEALSLSVRARICRRLLDLSSVEPSVHASQEHLAKSLGIARSAISVVLRGLVKDGAIKLGYREIRIVDRAALETYRDEQ
jgi:CRP/FNR family transcriptional regulator, cyclic AMP receptor protein